MTLDERLPTASDTPRTDEIWHSYCNDKDPQKTWEMIRQLEREAAALREKCRLEWDLRIVAERERDEAAAREREAIALLSRTLNHGLDETTERRVKTAGTLAQDITNWLGKVIVLRSGNDTDAAIRARSGEGRKGG